MLTSAVPDNASDTRPVRVRRMPLALLTWAVLALSSAGVANAQEVRYSWFDISFLAQDTSGTGSITDPGLGQTVAINVSDGNGVRFRGSLGTWNNMYAFVDYGSSDVNVDAIVINNQGEFEASDEFDLTSIRGGVGLKFSVTYSTDLYGELTYDSLDYDFGSFAGEDFDTGEKDFGGALGVRSMLGDRFEVRAHARFSNVGKVELGTTNVSSDTLYGAGFSFTLVRGLSITGDYETGEIDTLSIGFRLDLDED